MKKSKPVCDTDVQKRGLLGQFCSEKPDRQHHFYVMRIEAVFSAGIEGLNSDEP